MVAPKLRFKEFDKAFSRNTIKELAKIYVGRDLVEDAYSPIKTETHIYPIYSNSVDNEGLYGYYNFEEFNFDDDALTVVGRGAGLGKAFYRQGGFGTIGRLLSLTPKDKSFHPKYLSDYINDKLIIHNESGGIPQLPRSSLENYEVVLPSYEEQTKIAAFLSAVDEKISQLTQKHQLLSQYKQGMMQKLFSQQIRFKADDGSEFGEWEDKTISDIASYRRGSFPQPYGLPEWLDENGFPFVQVYDVAENMLLKDKTKIKISQLAANQSVLAKAGTLIITLQGSIGRVAKMQYDAYVDRTLLIFQSYAMPIDTDYFKYALYLLFNIEKEKADGGIIKTITKETLSKFNIGIPCLEEQTKIANFLSAIDQKIDVASEQLEQAKLWKKGLLQQMFV